jgi:hypothetical protein
MGAGCVLRRASAARTLSSLSITNPFTLLLTCPPFARDANRRYRWESFHRHGADAPNSASPGQASPTDFQGGPASADSTGCTLRVMSKPKTVRPAVSPLHAMLVAFPCRPHCSHRLPLLIRRHACQIAISYPRDPPAPSLETTAVRFLSLAKCAVGIRDPLLPTVELWRFYRTLSKLSPLGPPLAIGKRRSPPLVKHPFKHYFSCCRQKHTNPYGPFPGTTGPSSIWEDRALILPPLDQTRGCLQYIRD